jgi:phospholipid/cholesterol/gamma-HCH transport system substrate-binding protein
MRTTHSQRRLPNWAIGLILVVVIGVGSVLAYTKQLPWSDPYEVQAVFANAQNLRPQSPVRIAGVNVGEVTQVEHLTSDDESYQAATGDDTVPDDGPPGQEAAVVTMSLNEDALPLHEDAQMQLRPRLFLEGNLFVDLKPGSPNAPETEENHVFPIQQTSNSVQIDQVLTTLQADVRANLQTFLDQFGNALIKYDGAEAFQELFRSSAGAYKYTSIVNEALQGKAPHDLSQLIGNTDRVVAALDSDEAALQGLVSNFATVTGSFAAEDESLRQGIAKLPDVLDAAEPAFENLNASFPALRAFSREALPGVRSTAPAIHAATPFIEQVRELVAPDELRGLVADLRPTIPDLARLTARTKPFLTQARAASSCFNEVVIPWSNDRVNGPPTYPYQATGTVAQETGYGLVGVAGESHSGDANGQYIRVEAGGGSSTITMPSLPGQTDDPSEDVVGLLDFPLLGGIPSVHGQFADSQKTPFRPGVPCETQEQPDLTAGGVASGDLPETPDNPVDLEDLLGPLQDILDDIPLPLPFVQRQMNQAQQLQAAGDSEAAARKLDQAWATIDRALKKADPGTLQKVNEAAAQLGFGGGG